MDNGFRDKGREGQNLTGRNQKVQSVMLTMICVFCNQIKSKFNQFYIESS